MGEYITKDVCELKHKEVTEVKQTVKSMNNRLLITLCAVILTLGALCGNLFVMLK
jgi:hypothetical protein